MPLLNYTTSVPVPRTLGQVQALGHLELVTSAENTRRGDAHKTWAAQAAINQAKTYCPQGHAYDERNTYWSPRTGRMCRRCRADGEARRRARARS